MIETQGAEKKRIKHLKKKEPDRALKLSIQEIKTSKAEIILREVFKFYWPREKVIYNYRPDWLKNPKTGKNLELDIYYPDKNFAVEYQGPHHETLYQKSKDKLKKERCEEKGIFILRIYGIKLKSLRGILKTIGLKKMFPKHLKRKVRRYENRRSGGKETHYIKNVRITKYYDKIYIASDKQKAERESNRKRMLAKGELVSMRS